MLRNAEEQHKKTHSEVHLPGIILSGPFPEVISVNSLRILAAFFASDFRLEGIGLFTEIIFLKDILMKEVYIKY